MKKTYIAPEAVAYNVNAKCQTLVGSPRIINENADPDLENEAKGQLENESISIWDLY